MSAEALGEFLQTADQWTASSDVLPLVPDTGNCVYAIVVYRYESVPQLELAYIGATQQPRARMATHLKQRRWQEMFHGVVGWALNWYDDGPSMADAERSLLALLRPQWNKAGVTLPYASNGSWK